MVVSSQSKDGYQTGECVCETGFVDVSEREGRLRDESGVGKVKDPENKYRDRWDLLGL